MWSGSVVGRRTKAGRLWDLHQQRAAKCLLDDNRVRSFVVYKEEIISAPKPIPVLLT